MNIDEGFYVKKFCADVKQSFDISSGAKLAECLTLDNIYSSSSGNYCSNFIISSNKEDHLNVLHQINSYSVASNSVEEIAVLHLKCRFHLQFNDIIEAFNSILPCVQCFLKQMQQHKDNWALPAMIRLITDTRILSFRCSNAVTNLEKKSDKILEKTADVLMNCFRICCADTRTELKDSKRWGMLHIVNQLFKLYFRMNNTKLCKPLIRAIDGSPIKDHYTKAQLVTYKFFLGKVQLLESNFEGAHLSFSYAFTNCHPGCYENARKILNHLVPLKLLYGFMPSKHVLRKYNLSHYAKIANCVRVGDVRSLKESVDSNIHRFIALGVFVVLEKLTIVTYRNLLKRVYNMMMTSHRLNLNLFCACLKFLEGEDVDYLESELIVANLISDGYIKGYISHQHGILVLSKQNPFPSLAFLRQ